MHAVCACMVTRRTPASDITRVYSSREQKREPTHSARLRKQVHAAIVGKQADLAMQLVERHFPEVLTTSDSSAPLYLCCQSFIDKACSLPSAHGLHGTLLGQPNAPGSLSHVFKLFESKLAMR